MTWLQMIREIGELAALAAVAAPGSREAQIAALAGRITAQLAATLQRLADDGEVDLESLRVPGFDELVAEKLRQR